MSQKKVDDLEAELIAIRETLAALQTRHPNCTPMSQAPRHRVPRRWTLGWWSTLAGLLLVSSLVYAKGEGLFLDKDGKVGIGSSKPMTELDVEGTIRSSAGFQFSDGTKLTTAPIPPGAVIAFDLAKCPEGWTDYKPAYGRFVRGIDKDSNTSKTDPDGERQPGHKQEDAIRNIRGSIFGVSGMGNRAWPWGFRESNDPGNAFTVNSSGQKYYNPFGGGQYLPEGGVGTAAVFNAEKVVPVAPENRPKNVALLYCKKN